jgi:hypothetical protein
MRQLFANTRDFARRSYGSALSHGTGYESLPLGPSAKTDAVAGYFVDFRAKIASHPESPTAFREPTDLAQYALAWWERHELGDAEAAGEFERLCALIQSVGEHRDGWTLWPFTEDVPKYNMSAPWYSAMAQGQLASVLVRGQKLLGDHYGDLALRALEPLLSDNQSLGLVRQTAAGPILEEGAPCDPPSSILNGWVFALWGLWDAATALGDERSRSLYEKTIACLEKTLPAYDVGWWTKYSVFPHPIVDLAKPFYHRLHIVQADALAALTGENDFERAARRWEGYDRRAAAMAAVASKAPFIVANRLARRRSRNAHSTGRA